MYALHSECLANDAYNVVFMIATASIYDSCYRRCVNCNEGKQSLSDTSLYKQCNMVVLSDIAYLQSKRCLVALQKELSRYRRCMIITNTEVCACLCDLHEGAISKL
jgi:hypothetical protein